MKRLVLVINGKGGVGKSFFAVNFVQFLKDQSIAYAAIRVASYWTEALPRRQMEKKLHEAVRLARERLATATVSAELVRPKAQLGSKKRK